MLKVIMVTATAMLVVSLLCIIYSSNFLTVFRTIYSFQIKHNSCKSILKNLFQIYSVNLCHEYQIYVGLKTFPQISISLVYFMV